MHSPGLVARWLVAVLGLMTGAALIVGLPLGVWYVLSFLAEWVERLAFAPGFALYVIGICVPVGLIQLGRWRAREPSTSLRLPSAVWLAAGAILAIVLGQGLLIAHVVPLFWFAFVLAAALPPLAALGLAVQRLGGVTTWRRALAGLLSGSLLATYVTILLTAGISLLAFALVLPIREVVAHVLASPDLEHVFYSPALVLALIEVAVVAPLAEELSKPIGAVLLAPRLRSSAEAFLVGAACGVGFAIVENMLYESTGSQLWAGITTLRAIGGILHPLNAGLVSVGWYGVRRGSAGAWARLLGLYGLAVGAHALWNGGLTVLLSATGAYVFGADTWRLDVYGLGQPGVVVIFMVLEALALWRLLVVVTEQLRDSRVSLATPAVDLHLEQPRRLAVWATGLLVLIVPVGALYAPLLERYASRLLPLGP